MRLIKKNWWWMLVVLYPMSLIFVALYSHLNAQTWMGHATHGYHSGHYISGSSYSDHVTGQLETNPNLLFNDVAANSSHTGLGIEGRQDHNFVAFDAATLDGMIAGYPGFSNYHTYDEYPEAWCVCSALTGSCPCPAGQFRGIVQINVPGGSAMPTAVDFNYACYGTLKALLEAEAQLCQQD